MSKLWRRISYWWRGLEDKAADSIDDPVRDSKYTLEDAKAKYNKFQSSIANFVAANSQLSRELAEHSNEVDKWKDIATNAASKGNADDARTALQNQIKAEKQVEDTKTRLETSKKEADKLRDQLASYEEEINVAEKENAQFAARLQGANLRKEIAQTNKDLDGQFAEIHELKNRANKAVDLADAYEVLGADPNADLVVKYGNKDAGLEARLAQLMATNK